MYLLNRQQLTRHAEDPTSNYLTILNFSKKNLQHTSYYFRLGDTYEIVSSPDEKEIRKISKTKPILTVEPNQYILIRSEEIFRMSNKVKAMIGSCGLTVKNGLLVNYSPFIDPLYDGYLEVGLKNLLSVPVHLKALDIIGKLSFFDISDTYPIEIVSKSIQAEKFALRANYEYSDDGVIYPDYDDDSGLFEKKKWSR
jgi:deoxycytidine triphosphate deaminase